MKREYIEFECPGCHIPYEKVDVTVREHVLTLGPKTDRYDYTFYCWGCNKPITVSYYEEDIKTEEIPD